MQRRFTRDEVVRILGVTRRQLDYWARLRLISPELRWGERFYTFTDLVALETMKRLTSRGLPARRLRRALEALREQIGEVSRPAYHKLLDAALVGDGDFGALALDHPVSGSVALARVEAG